ncbi:MAG TPA: hypothetical protein DD418_04360 [Pseudomonas sp.]|nr:hypothetical protein [Pseudomonas sp.]
MSAGACQVIRPRGGSFDSRRACKRGAWWMALSFRLPLPWNMSGWWAGDSIEPQPPGGQGDLAAGGS